MSITYLRKQVIAAAICAAAAVGGVALGDAAHAAGGNGESFCSTFGAPTDEYPNGDPGNIGEVISWTAQNVGHSGDFNPGEAHNDLPPFPKRVCNPN